MWAKHILLHTNTLSRLFFLAAFLFSPIALVSAATEVTTNISSDIVWSKEAGPYVVMSTIAVTQGATLTVEPGTIIKFNETRKLNVEGALYINGTEAEPVSITSIHDDSVGGDSNQNGTSTSVDRYAHRFGGITFASGSNGEMKYLNIRFAGYATPASPIGAAIYNQGATIAIQNTVIEDCGSFGIGQISGTLGVTNSQFKANQIGIAIKNGDISIENTLIKNSSNFGLVVGGQGSLVLRDTIFENNYIAAGMWLDGGRQFTLTNNSASGNEFNGFLLRGPVVGNVTLPKSDGISYYVSGIGGSPDGTGALSFSNSSQLEVLTGATLALEAGAVIKSEKEVGIEVRGQLTAAGTGGEPVVFTAYTDSIEGSIRSGTPSVGSAGYIRAYPGSTVLLDYTKMQFGSGPFQSYQGTIVNIGGSINITNSSLTDSKQHALYQQLGTSVVNNSFVGDIGRFGIYNAATVPLDATNNYWADPTGPTHSSNPGGVGAYMSDNVTATPWLTEFEFNPPPPPPPTGASSVLFLPGIQASRLYKDGVLGTEDRIWEPNSNQDVNQLALTSDGLSVNDIYTRDVIDEAAIPLLGKNIYKDFLAFLKDLDEKEIIESYEAFAYDWRFSVNDIVMSGTKYENEVKSLVVAFESLAQNSYTGKVTIIGHSNGGLLAKALTIELERLGKGNLVDEIIFIGTPHLGTPKAIGTVLHGYDQQKLGGTVIDDKDARAVINNMPGAYALLPSEAYLNKSSSPIISFGAGSVTTPMRLRYGTSVNTMTEYTEFLIGAEGRTNVYENISLPYITNQGMLNNALLSHRDRLDNWRAPANVSVHNVVGVGLKTIKALEYREVVERTSCTANIFGQINCPPAERLLRPYAQFTQYGDETVTNLSAESVIGENHYFNFDKYRNENLLFDDESHADFTEIAEVQTLIKNLITEELGTVDYITSQQPTFIREFDIITIDSPVRALVTDGQGKRTGLIEEGGERVTVKEIPGSEYIEFGGTKYLIIPSDISATTTLFGEDYGSYTLTTATLKQNEIQEVKTYLSDATTTPQMIANFSLSQGTTSPIHTDINGDGTIDYKSTLNGQIIVEAPAISFSILRQEIVSLGLSKSRQKPLLVLVELAEQLTKSPKHKKINAILADETLQVLSKLIIQYEKQRWISKAQATSLQITIKKLRTNIKQ